ncbi:MAG: 30S ribosomal protein S6 [Patescibacteria group bacterium]
MAQHYEILFIVSSKVDDAQLEGVVKGVREEVTKLGGQITKSESLGKQKLAYEIKHQQFGTYVLMEFDAEGGAYRKLNGSLRLKPEIIRHLIVRKRVKTASEVAKEQRIQEKAAERRAAEAREVEEQDRAAALPAEKKEPIAQRKAADRAKEEKKISLEDLDKKLDDILKEEI